MRPSYFGPGVDDFTLVPADELVVKVERERPPLTEETANVTWRKDKA